MPIRKSVLLWLSFQLLFASFAAAKSQTYMLSNPIDTDTALGPAARVFWPTLLAAAGMLKVTTLYAATGEPVSTFSYGALEVVKLPAFIAGWSKAHLKARQWWANRKQLREVARIPGVTRVMMISTGAIEYEGPLAARQKNLGYIFVESTEPLSPTMMAGTEWAEKFGEPVLIESTEKARLVLTLEIAGEEYPLSWTTNLKDVFEKSPMPDDIAKEWTTAVRKFDRRQSLRSRFLTHAHDPGIKVATALVLPDGQLKPLRPLAEGKGVRDLLGMGIVRRVKERIKAVFLRRPVSPELNLPFCELLLSDTRPR